MSRFARLAGSAGKKRALTFVSGAVNGTAVSLVFSEPVQLTNLNGLTIRVNGDTGVLSALSGSGTTTLSMTLGTAALAGDVVTFSYNPALGDLRNAANIELSALTNAAITNNTPLVSGAIIMATNGTSGGAGTVGSPATAARAATLVAPGGTIYVRGGTYTGTFSFGGKNGTSGSRIMIRPYPGETVIFDGTGGGTSTITVELGAYQTFQQFEVRNSNYIGVGSWERNGAHVKYCNIHGVRNQGIYLGGSAITSGHFVHRNTVFDCCRHNNTNQFPTGGWAQAVTIFRGDNSFVTANIVHSTWGEGIGIQSSMDCFVTDNFVYDCLSAGIYLDSGQDATVQGNHIYNTGATSFYRDSNTNPMYAVLAGNEDLGRDLPSSGINVTNNISAATRTGSDGNATFEFFNTGRGFTLQSSTVTPNTHHNTYAAYQASL